MNPNPYFLWVSGLSFGVGIDCMLSRKYAAGALNLGLSVMNLAIWFLLGGK